MPWQDDFVDELLTRTGLDTDQLVDIILEFPQNAAERQQRERQAAKQRARVLLLDHLDDGQRTQFEDRGRFFVTGSDGGRYCVHLGRQHNVWSVDDDGQHRTNYCIHVRDNVPDEDNVLAQMLLLQGNEGEFVRIANSRQER